MNHKRKYQLYFKNVPFHFVEYNNGVARYKTDFLDDDGDLTSYDIIISVDDNWLEVVEDEYGEYHIYTIEDIYDRANHINEINQSDIYEIKVDTLFSNVNRHYEKGI